MASFLFNNDVSLKKWRLRAKELFEFEMPKIPPRLSATFLLQRRLVLKLHGGGGQHSTEVVFCASHPAATG